MASTTSTEQSGLFGHLLPLFKQATGIDVRVVAVGTGQALDIGRRGDADIVFVHDTGGRGEVRRRRLCDQAPAGDVQRLHRRRPGVRSGQGQGQRHRRRAGARFNASGASFISRADKSGTHAAELRLWKAAGVDVAAAKPAGYKECGCGMGPALNMGSSTNAYVLTDRGTWLSFKNRGDLAILVEGDKRLFNQYGVMVVNPAKHPHVKSALAQQFADWVVSPAGQAGDRRLQDRRAATVLPQRRPLTQAPMESYRRRKRWL